MLSQSSGLFCTSPFGHPIASSAPDNCCRCCCDIVCLLPAEVLAVPDKAVSPPPDERGSVSDMSFVTSALLPVPPLLPPPPPNFLPDLVEELLLSVTALPVDEDDPASLVSIASGAVADDEDDPAPLPSPSPSLFDDDDDDDDDDEEDACAAI